VSGSVWAVALGLPVLTVAAVASLRAEAVVVRHRAEDLADRAALAGADALAMGHDPCVAAGGLVARDRGVLSGCAVDGWTVRVTVTTSTRLPLAGRVHSTVAAAARPADALDLPVPEVPVR
jgi:secretion/DNA translocation related TadE-like protein